MENKYQLQKYSGISSRYTCPNCGRKRCFTLYVDEDNEPIAANVGRCDHESSCGYHYTPREYFHDHPDCHSERSEESLRESPAVHQRPPVHRVDKVDKRERVDTLPADIVARSIRPTYDSDFITFLRTLFDTITVASLIQEYRLGVTRDRAVIFYQVDTQGRIRTGKVMKYDPETGHRIKDENTKGRITWVHSLMKYTGQLPPDWTLTQCLFGEHLLPLFPEKPVALVESEKTAVICAGLIPKFLWLATGGKSQLNDRLHVLRGRSVTAFPDIDGYDTWCRKATELCAADCHPEAKPKDLNCHPERHPDCHPERSEGSLHITVSDLLQKHGTAQDRADHIDIADWLIRWHRTPNPRADATFAAIAQYFSPDIHEEIKAFIHDLDLEIEGVYL